jgi:hypothetical protein
VICFYGFNRRLSAGMINVNSYAGLIVEATKIKLAATMLAPGVITRLRKIAKSYDIIHVHHLILWLVLHYLCQVLRKSSASLA